MSKSQRTKGANGEREVCKLLAEEFGVKVGRELGQARDSGCDIRLQSFVFEIKRRKRIATYEWLEQAEAASKPGEMPVVMARADGKDWLVMMPWWVAARLIRGELK